LANRGLIATVLKKYMLSRVDVDDLTQETVVRALEAERRTVIQEPKRFLIGIAKNVARSEIQRQSKSVVGLLDDIIPQGYESDEPSVEAVVDSRQRMGVFAEAIGELPLQCQKVFVLKYLYGASHKDISAKLGIAISTVEKHVALGLRRCRQHMMAAQRGDNAEISETNVLGLETWRRKR
jgi:RNA polymerase sigma-70 factor (ECF subfamily)